MRRNRNKTYLHSSGAYELGAAPVECACCDRLAKHWVRWAFTYMRGEDEVYPSCEKHLAMAKKSPEQDRYFGHMRSKPRYLTARTVDRQSNHERKSRRAALSLATGETK